MHWPWLKHKSQMNGTIPASLVERIAINFAFLLNSGIVKRSFNIIKLKIRVFMKTHIALATSIAEQPPRPIIRSGSNSCFFQKTYNLVK